MGEAAGVKVHAMRAKVGKKDRDDLLKRLFESAKGKGGFARIDQEVTRFRQEKVLVSILLELDKEAKLGYQEALCALKTLLDDEVLTDQAERGNEGALNALETLAKEGNQG